MIQGIEDTGCARMGPATSSPSAMRYSFATLINNGFTFKKSGGGPGSSGAFSIDEQAAKPRQATAIVVTTSKTISFLVFSMSFKPTGQGHGSPVGLVTRRAAPSAMLWT